jgi:hypothetical protein
LGNVAQARGTDRCKSLAEAGSDAMSQHLGPRLDEIEKAGFGNEGFRLAASRVVKLGFVARIDAILRSQCPLMSTMKSGSM